MRLKTLAALCAAFTLFAVIARAQDRPGAREVLKENKLLSVGTHAPDWTLADSLGTRHALKDYRGRVVVLDLWATWCKPCEKLMPRMQKLHERYSSRGVVVFGVNAWEKADAAAFVREKRVTYGQLLNGEAIAADYGVINLPVVYVVGADGTVIYRREGIGDEDDLTKAIEKHLKERGM